GSMLRRSGHVVRRAHGAARRGLDRLAETSARLEPAYATEAPPAPLRPHAPPVDGAEEFPDIVGVEHTGPPPLLVHPGDDAEPEPPSLSDARPSAGDYRLPDREILHRSKEGAGPSKDASARIADALTQTLRHFGVDATVVGEISGPRVTRFELQLA